MESGEFDARAGVQGRAVLHVVRGSEAPPTSRPPGPQRIAGELDSRGLGNANKEEVDL